MTSNPGEARPGHDALLNVQIVDSRGQAVVDTDPAAVVTYWNPAAEALFEFSTEEAVGCRGKELLVPRESRAHTEQTLRILTSGEPRSNEVPVRDEGVRVFPLRFRCATRTEPSRVSSI